MATAPPEAPDRCRFTFELSEELDSALRERARRTERTPSGLIRHILSSALGLTDSDESPDAEPRTPLLPGMVS